MATSYRRASVKRVSQIVGCALFLFLCTALAIFRANGVQAGEQQDHSKSHSIIIGGPDKDKFKDRDDDDKNGGEVKTVFVIAMENHNWTQPENPFSGGIQQIYQNVNAPFINSLVDGSAVVLLDGRPVNISREVSYAAAYHNVLATPEGNNPHIHPSEPNYIWAEAGDNFGVASDADPYTGGTNQDTTDHLSSYLTREGKTWKSYQEDIDLTKNSDGQLTSLPLPRHLYTSPFTSFSGVFAPGSINPFNLSNQYNYAVKHNPMAFFSDTNGGNDATTSNPLAGHYAPLQQLAIDLAEDKVADYNWITPDQYNDMHTALTGGYKGLTGDAANLKQGDDFIFQILPMIMESKAYKNNGVIILWWDESEEDGVANDNSDDFNHTIPEIVISKLAHKNVHGAPYASPALLTHSSDLRTMQEIFHAGPFLRDAANSNDLSDLFRPGAIPRLKDKKDHH